MISGAHMTNRQFRSMVRREAIKVEVEVQRSRARPVHLPLCAMLKAPRWSLGRNRFRRH